MKSPGCVVHCIRALEERRIAMSSVALSGLNGLVPGVSGDFITG
jgi:hypothetical protein